MKQTTKSLKTNLLKIYETDKKIYETDNKNIKHEQLSLYETVQVFTLI